MTSYSPGAPSTPAVAAPVPPSSHASSFGSHAAASNSPGGASAPGAAPSIAQLHAAFERDGFCVLPSHFSAKAIDAWAAAFAPLLEEHVRREAGRLIRGPARHYVTLPFAAPFADPAFFENETVLDLVFRLVGDDAVMCQLASDTPLLGSDYQEVHRDAKPLFPEAGIESPSFQLALNFPLCDVTAENGPMEIARGTHRMSKTQALAAIDAGVTRLEPIYMRKGDVLLRDVRGLHRGTPNRTDVPRPMVVIGYSRGWLLRPEVSIDIPRAALESLSPRARKMLRYNPVVDSLDAVAGKQERYEAFAY